MGLLTLSLGPWQWFWMVFYAFATWGNAGFMREAVCKYMCPYARFQSVMVDDDTFVVTYDYVRGEPRGGRSRRIDHKEAGMGDCRSEEHTSELQSLMRISYAVFCLKKKQNKKEHTTNSK